MDEICKKRPSPSLSLAILILIMVVVGPAYAKILPPVLLDPASPLQTIDENMGLLNVPDQDIGIEDILSMPIETYRAESSAFPGKFDTAAQWRFFSLKNPTSQSIRTLVEVRRLRLNYVDFYSINEALQVTHYESGNRRPFSVRPYPHRSFIFPVTVEAGKTVRVLLRIQSEGAIVVTARAWSVDAFTAYSTEVGWYYGILHGTALVVVLLAAVGAFLFRDRASFWLLVQVAGFHIRLSGLSGHLNEFLLPEQPLLADMLGNFAIGPGLAGGFMFMVEFLALRDRLPLIAVLFQMLALASVLLGATTFIGYYGIAAPLVNAAVLAYALLSAALLVYFLVRRERGLGLLCLGIAIPTAAIIVRIGRNFGLPVDADLAEWCIYAGFYGYALILGIAIVRHVRRIEEERLRLAYKALDETAKRESILNRMVEERTLELEKSQRKLMENLDRERESRQEQRNFLSMVSHEFKTPMSIILASVSIMSECRLDQAETAEEMANIVAAVARMQGLVEKCLSDEWLDQAAMVLDTTSLDIHALLQELLVVQRMKQEGRVFILTVRGTPRPVNGDDMLLRMMFANVIDNAAKYSPLRTPVTVDLLWADDGVQVSVTDMGEPISAHDRVRIFEKFYRSPHQRRKEGAGLGLYLVKRIAGLHGGNIYLSDPKPSGNSFVITLAG